MPTGDSRDITAKHWQDCSDVYDFLDQIRLRPGVWLLGGSLHHLQSMLIGYQVALGAHSIEEPCDFWPGGAFSQWLATRLDGSSALGWAATIEHSTPDGSTPVDEFFRLLDAYRGDVAHDAASTTATHRFPGIEYMHDTFVTLFWRRRLLTQAVTELEGLGFRVVHLAAGQWTTEQEMHRAIAAALHFPDYYGRNLDALNDCLGDVACYGGYDDTLQGAGLVLAFTDYERFAAAWPRTAHIVLEIIAAQARRASVRHHRFFALVHSNDPDIRFEPVGAMPVLWNSDEWTDR
ncbi:barstar family protein [Streptomyces kunmingensis]|uniref:Barstar family protein n=1 Tax=Streptomyces kunmingensis TaxID=68225 RepID=A0ABU6CEP5_9ACTN|nr:barstar family protein [Streptomyces kunmingensis]MEB3963178.1 barstar family protein [Streptomyces kunmingensis]